MIVLKKPIITEKMTRISEKESRYGFIVDKKANKIEIKKAVEAMYGVNVEAVNTLNFFGKKKVRYTKTSLQEGKTPAVKKAIVRLKKGETIDFYSGI